MKNERNRKIDEILGSFDGSQKAKMPPFFYTRLKAKMLAQQEGTETVQESNIKKSWILRPVYAFAVLVVVLLVNAFVILKGSTNNEVLNDITATDSDTLQSIAAEYSLNDNNTLYDLNQDK